MQPLRRLSSPALFMINYFLILFGSSSLLLFNPARAAIERLTSDDFVKSGRGARSATRPLGRNIERAQCPQRSHVGGVSGTQRIVRIVALSL